ncbi:MAG: DsrE family protein [Desulfobacteraceae bacterium]|jgi:predicted peroxiredoxin|nr:DsrE family protein [Desulfobacteraceae bacterium]
MAEKEEKILYICTHAGEDPEKAAMPFVMANAAITMDIKTTIALQGNGVYLAQKGYVDTMLPAGGFPPVKKLIHDFMEHGGKLLVCVPCIKERNINEDSDMIDGAQTTAAGTLTVEALESDAVFVY